MFLQARLKTIASTALLKFGPEDGSPYRFPNTWRTIPFGAMMPSSVVMQRRKSMLPGVTKYAPTRSPPAMLSHIAQTMQRKS